MNFLSFSPSINFQRFSSVFIYLQTCLFWLSPSRTFLLTLVFRVVRGLVFQPFKTTMLLHQCLCGWDLCRVCNCFLGLRSHCFCLLKNMLYLRFICLSVVLALAFMAIISSKLLLLLFFSASFLTYFRWTSNCTLVSLIVFSKLHTVLNFSLDPTCGWWHELELVSFHCFSVHCMSWFPMEWCLNWMLDPDVSVETLDSFILPPKCTKLCSGKQFICLDLGSGFLLW